MDEFLRQLTQNPGAAETVSIVQTVLAVLTSFILSLLIVYTYRATHQGTSYSQSYAQTLVLMSVVTSVIMLIIGGSIPRAFSLVGALSIIRYRSAIKEPRDVAFLFLAMAIGIACGTRFWSIAVTLALSASAVAYFLFKFNIGAKGFSEVLLKAVVDKDLDYNKAFGDLFYTYLKSQVLLSVDALTPDTFELVYSVKLKDPGAEHRLLESVRACAGCRRVSLLRGLQNINV